MTKVVQANKSLPKTLTRAVYPDESLRFGSVPLWMKDLTLSKSPSTAADQIPANHILKLVTQVNKRVSLGNKGLSVWLTV